MGTSARLFYDARDQSQTDVSDVNGSGVTLPGHHLTLLSGDGADSLTGGAGNDSLSSGDGSDTVSGGRGNDTIVGGLGQDTLSGGTGDDIFSFGFGIPRSESSPNIRDTISDFEDIGVAGGDQIDLPSFNNATPLLFNLNPIDFDIGKGIGDSGEQLPAELIGDGFVDVVWRNNVPQSRMKSG